MAYEISSFVENKIGPSIVISGDNLRQAFDYVKFDKKSRLKYALNYSKWCKKISDSNYKRNFCYGKYVRCSKKME